MKTTRAILHVNEDDTNYQSDNDNTCQSVSLVSKPLLCQALPSLLIHHPERREKTAQLVSTTNITDAKHRQGSGGKSRVDFMNAMQGVAMEVPSIQSGPTFGTTSSPVILGDGWGSNFGSWTPRTSCMADPTGIFHPSWNITCENDVLDPTYKSEFKSNVFPQVTLS